MKKNPEIQESLVLLIENSLSALDLDEKTKKDLPLEFSISGGFGDLSNNVALRLSSILRKPPLEIAKTLAEEIKKHIHGTPLEEDITDVKAEGAGFLNFYLTHRYFYLQLEDILAQKDNFAKSNSGKGKNVLIEFVSANPTGPLSVAHARQAVVGDALANILGFLGFKVQREYYLNDEGNQINILGKSIELRMKELDGEKLEFPENYYQGDYIYDIAKKVSAKKIGGSAFGEKSIAEFGAEDILSTIEQELADFGVRFDNWYSQKKLRESGKIDEALDYLKEKGFLYEQEGALWFKSTALGDDKDRVVIKSDGSYTYLAPDIAYHKDKYGRGFQWLINLWGPDHHGYINRLKAAVKALGHEVDSLSVLIVQLATIFRDGKPVEMSTRKGQYITLREVLDEVGRDASRFFFIMRRTSSHLNFDLETAKKQTSENPVYYVQYAYARICSILRSADAGNNLAKADLSLLKEKEEIALAKKLWQFSFVLQVCYKTVDPYPLTIYLQEIAEEFHRFYDHHRVLGQDEGLTFARLALIQATNIVLSIGLDLLGISKPEKM